MTIQRLFFVTKILKNQGLVLKTIGVNLGVNYSYLAIQLERSASFASLIRLYVNSRFTFCSCPNECNVLHWWAEQMIVSYSGSEILHAVGGG